MYCIRVLYLTCPCMHRSFVLESTRELERKEHGKAKWHRTWRLNPHFSFLFTSRTSSMPVAFRHQYLIPWAVALTLIAWREKERVMYVYTHIRLLESRRGKAPYSMIGCLNQSVFPLPLPPSFPFESMSGHYAFVRTAFDFGAWQQGRADSLILHEQHLPFPNFLPIKLSTECPKVVASTKSSDPMCIVQCLLLLLTDIRIIMVIVQVSIHPLTCYTNNQWSSRVTTIVTV